MDWPPPGPEPETRLTRVARLDQLVADRARIVRVGIKRIALFLIDGRVHATSNVCPHAGGSLGRGCVDGRYVICPRHEWAFDIETGACPDHDLYALTTYTVEVRGDEVWVAIPESRW